MEKTSAQVGFDTELGHETRELLEFSEEEKQENQINKANAGLVWSPKFIPFYPDIMEKHKLTYSETLLYGFIDFYFSLASKNARFYFTNEQLSGILKCNDFTITRGMDKLKELGIINPKYRIKSGGGKVRFIERIERSDTHLPHNLCIPTPQNVGSNPTNCGENKNKINKNKIKSQSQRIAKPQNVASPPVLVPKTMSEPQKLIEEAARIYKEGTGEEYKRTDKDYGIAAKMVKSYGLDLAMAKLNAFGRFCKGKTFWFTKEGFVDFSLGALWHHWNAIIRAPDKEAKPNAPPGQSAVTFFVSPEYKDSREQIEAAKQKYGSNWWRYLGGAK